jgi:formylglycine-generating enzyme required for sulfatase activity
MGNKPSYFNNAAYYQTRPVEQVTYYHIRENPANIDDPAVNWPNNSVVNANSFMGKMRAKTGLAEFDLPTESQWEHACRAGTTTALNSGYNLTSTTNDPRMSEVGRNYANHPGGYSSSPSVNTNGGTAAVGSYLGNAWGLYDMHGNAMEWCLDWWDGISPGPVTDPKGPTASGTDARVIRSGSWDHYPHACRSALRYNITGGQATRSRGIGFRACSAAPSGHP